MVGAAQGVLDVAENRIHPSKLGALNSGSPAAHHHRLMNAARRGDAMKAGQPIGDDPSACTEVELRPGGDFGETEALHDGELHAQRVSLLVGLDGGDKGRLAGRTTTALAPTSFATEIGVIELDPSAECVLAVSLHHHLHQLVSDTPCGVVGDPQMAVQLHRRNALFVLGHEVDGLKPHRQEQLGGVEDGSCGDRGLAVAAIALLELAAVELAASVVATVRAQKPIGPSPLIQGVEALVFGAVEREECVEADSFLKLYRVAVPCEFPFLIIDLHGDILVESRAGTPTLGSGGDSDTFAPCLNPAPIVTFPAPALRTRRADFRHRALQWDHAPRTRTAGKIPGGRWSDSPDIICGRGTASALRSRLVSGAPPSLFTPRRHRTCAARLLHFCM